MANNMRPIFYTGDLVEILNLSDSQIYSIRSQTCDFKKQPNRDIVGMRYKLSVSITNYSYGDVKEPDEIRYSLIGWNHGGHFTFWDANQLKLVRRPFKNWVKNLLAMLKEIL